MRIRTIKTARTPIDMLKWMSPKREDFLQMVSPLVFSSKIVKNFFRVPPPWWSRSIESVRPNPRRPHGIQAPGPDKSGGGNNPLLYPLSNLSRQIGTWNALAVAVQHAVYLVLKNLVLWARSEVFGYASQSFNRNNGTMDEWNGGLAFHCSNISACLSAICTAPLWGEIKAWSCGPG